MISSVNNFGKVYHHNNLEVSHLIVVPDDSKKVHITLNQQQSKKKHL